MKSALAAAVLLLVPAPAGADPCERDRIPPPRPIALSIGPADFATTPGACSEWTGAIEGRASLLVDRPDFYGAIGLEAVLSGTFVVSPRTWISGALSALEYRQVINANIVSSAVDLGPTTLAVHRTLVRTDRWIVSPFFRILVPTDTAYRYAVRAGFEPGGVALFRPTERVSVMGGLTLPAAVTVLAGHQEWTFTPRLSVDGAWAPWRWFEGALGIEARFGLDPAGALEFLAPKVALRFFPWRGLLVQLAAMAIVAGIERTDYRAMLGIGWSGE